MEKIALVTDTTCDLSDEQLKEYDIKAIPLQVIYDNEIIYKDRFEISLDKIIQDIDNHNIKTSLPIASDVTCVFDEIIREGYTHVLLYSLSASISGTNNLFKQIAEQYSDQIKTHVILSKAVSLGFGYTLLKARELANSGVPFPEIVNFVEKMNEETSVFFCVDDLKYLQKGGRISKTSQVLGSLLDIYPIIDVKKKDGSLGVIQKVRGEKKSIKTLLQLIEEAVGENEVENIFVVHSDRLKNAEVLRRQITKKYPNANVTLSRLSSLLTIHTGPGLYGLGVHLKA